MIYIFDGSLAGLLTSVFDWFEHKPGKVTLKSIALFQPEAFAESYTVITDAEKSDRVWAGLQKKLKKDCDRGISISVKASKIKRVATLPNTQ